MPVTKIDNVSTNTRHGQTALYVNQGFGSGFSISGDFANIQTTTGFMLVDLSNTGTWPHTNTDHLVIDYIVLEINGDTSYRGSVEIGYLLNVDGTDGDFVEVFGADFTTKSDTVIESIDFGSHGLHCTNNLHFGLTTANSTVFQTDVDLEGPDGNTSYSSGDGDLVLLVTRTGGIVDVEVTLGYETASTAD